MTQVFLSHSTADAQFALQLATNLRAAGIPVWKAPESILDGEEWVAAIQRGLTTSTHLLLLKSPAAVKSKWVNFEFNAALTLEKQGKMRIVPVDYLPCNPPLFWTLFQHVTGIHDEYHATLFKILARLRQEQPTHPPQPTNAATTINVTVHGDVSGQLNVAGSDITYAQQPAEPPPDSEVDILSILPPPFEWCEIPGKQGFSLETDDGNMGSYDIAPFFMAKYQITYQQFQGFIDAADGFGNDEWWQGLAKRESSPGTQKWKINNHPRENVNWYDAVAFCRWLSSKVGYEVRLPTEWEWQWAAQGPDGWAYPWGNDYIKGYANIDEKSSGIDGGAYLKKTTPVGSYPEGASPYGVLDMSGNVWEWCLNEYDEPGRVATSGDAARVLRGGSWHPHGLRGMSAARVATTSFLTTGTTAAGFGLGALSLFFSAHSAPHSDLCHSGICTLIL